MYKDFTIQDGGLIYYRETAAKSDLVLYQERIQANTEMKVMVKRAIVITYVNMQEVAVESSRYSFQVNILCFFYYCFFMVFAGQKNFIQFIITITVDL